MDIIESKRRTEFYFEGQLDMMRVLFRAARCRQRKDGSRFDSRDGDRRRPKNV